MPFEKRSFDLVMTCLFLIILSPILLLLTILIMVIQGPPILFHQLRAGYKGRLFYLYKFRTMTNERSSDGSLLPDSQRVTQLGRILRSSSLDELPELINVLRGEMSLVGPRPLLAKYLHVYSPEQMRRHNMLPGVTGWAQINGRNVISWEERFKLDLWYVDNWSFWLDIRIILVTIWKSIKQEDIDPPDKVTMEEFTGDN